MNAISNIPFLAKVLLPLLAVITLWLLSGEDDVIKGEKSYGIIRSSDYAMTDFTMTIMDDEGEPSRVIMGSEMAHYPEDDSTDIIFPITQFINKEKEIWILSSNKATMQGKGEDIFLTGNVIITRENNNEIELLTEELHLDTEHDTAYTDAAVTLKSPEGETNSVGLHAALADRTINIHSRVKGQYNAPPTQ